MKHLNTSILHLIARLESFVSPKQELVIIRFVNDSNFQIEKYTVSHQERQSGRGEELSIFVHKEVYFKPRTDLSINSNDIEPICIKKHYIYIYIYIYIIYIYI